MRSTTKPRASARPTLLVGLGLLAIGLAGCGGSPAAPVPTGTTLVSPATHAAGEADPASPSAQPSAPGAAPRKLVGDDRGSSQAPSVAPRPMPPQEPSPFRFAEIAREAGVDFVHFSGMTPEKYFPTANGSGAAFLDYDGDGLLDLYFATATLLPLGTAEKGPNRLYRNLGGGRFEDVTERAHVGFRGFCHGIIVGDIDNDGDPDLFLCNYGANVLYKNNGDGTFADISKASGIDRPGWSSGGAMFDMDDDGDLDIYVANYGIWRYPEDDHFCGDPETKIRLYCSPRSVKTTKHFFYKNNGDGTFTDVLDDFLVNDQGQPIPGRSDGHGFAVVAADLDDDGKVDLYVANDMNPNFLFRNKGNGKFTDETEASGAAYDERGQPQSGMGVDAADINGDGVLDLIASNFDHEYNTIHLNMGSGQFQDLTTMFGLGADTTPYVGWGLALADFDADGWPDCFVANGHVDDNREQLGQATPYAEPSLLHRNSPIPGKNGRRFRLSTRDVGPYFATPHVARGAAFGDFDNDGDIDIAVNHKDRPAALLRNDTPRGANRWLQLQLVGTKSNRDAVGAKVTVQAGDRAIVQHRKGGTSVFSAHDPRLTIGLGAAGDAVRVTVRWPSGATTVRERVPIDSALRIVEGE